MCISQASHREVFGRDHTVGEVTPARKYVSDQHLAVRRGPWEEFTQVLLGTNELSFQSQGASDRNGDPDRVQSGSGPDSRVQDPQKEWHEELADILMR